MNRHETNTKHGIADKRQKHNFEVIELKNMNEQLEEAIDRFRAAAAGYARTERYYRGEHDLAFASEKFQNTFGSLFREFAMNMCPAICDALKDKLKITDFHIEAVTRDSANAGGSNESDVIRKLAHVAGTQHGDDLASAIRGIWLRNRMASRSGEVHGEVIKNGDAYAVVWPDANGRAAIYPNKALSMTAVYDEEDAGRIRWAAKRWRTADKRTRLNLFFPDRIEKYISVRETEGFLPDAKDFVPLSQKFAIADRASASLADDRRRETSYNKTNGGSESDSVVPNPYGVVPVFHFANNADLGSSGRSELDAAIPVQDGLNKAVLDMLVAMEFSAYRQRWAAGIEIEYDSEGKAAAPFKAGIDHLWISENPNARFGDFDSANLEQFLKVKDSFRIDLASVTGTPLYYLMPQTRGFPSGESLRKAETRFIAKVRDRQETFGQTWADVMRFAAMIDGLGEVRISTAWEDPSPLTDRELFENILLKRQIGISPEQALRETGYGDIDIKRMTKK